jgi:1-acyl-sn-glycerol-3-phosphate acyltransferase
VSTGKLQPDSPSRPRYSPRVVRFVLRFQRLVSRLGLSGLLYKFIGTPLYLTFRWGVFCRNEVLVYRKDRLPPPEAGYFLLCNHISMAEAPSLASVVFPKPLWFPAKAEFYKNWLAGLIWTLATGARTFPVRRGERDAEAIGLMEQFLAKGDSVLLFPEGTRSKDGELLPGKKGVGMIIHSARPVVVPVYARGFETIWSHRSWLPLGTGQRAYLAYGEPLDLSHHWDAPTGPETGQAIVDDVMAAIVALEEELEAHLDLVPPPR